MTEKEFEEKKNIKLNNKIGAEAEIYYGFDLNKNKYIFVDIISNTILRTFFQDLKDVNVFLKSLGFDEIKGE